METAENDTAAAAAAANTSVPATVSTSPSSPPMLCAFARDSGSCFQLTDFLILNELAQLVGSCTAWKAWLAAPRSLAARMRELAPSSLPLFARCEWVRQHVVSVEIKQGEPEQLEQALALLSLFHRLQSLLITTKGQLIEEPVFERCFGSIRATLTQFEISLPTDHSGLGPGHNDAVIQACINQCKQLGKLKHLRVTGTIANAAAIGFSPISALPLETLRIGRPLSNYSLTAAQTKQICLIRTLTTVDLGAWLLPAEALTVDGSDTAATSELLQQGIGAFARSRRGASPLRFLQLSQSLMNAEFFACLCAIPSLESIWPKRWRAGMGPEDWKQLRLFTALRKLSVCPENENELSGRMTVDEVLDGLGHCPTLTEIQLGSGFLLRPAHVEQIARNLPALGCLVLFHCKVQSLAPLVDAPSLTSLDLRACLDHEGSPPHWRITLPSLPRLAELIIVDRAGTELTPKLAEPLNAALLARMPSLTLAKFTQNLAAEEEIDVSCHSLSMSSSSNSTIPSSPTAPTDVPDEAATESSIASPSASTDDCPMLRLLALDSGSMFQLLRFLPLLSMASLYASCRQWSEWLRVGGKIVRRYRPVKPSRFHQLLGSWVQLHITQLNLIRESDDPDAASDDATKLPLGPRLRVLIVYASQQFSDPCVNSFMRSLDAVPKLTELKIAGPFNGDAIDFRCLPVLAESLLTLQLIPEPSNGWRCTPPQSRMLAQCTRLTKVDVGSYGAIAGRPLESDSDLDGLRLFVESRCSAETADSVEWLWLNQSTMTSDLFSSLVRLPSLHSIWPALWSAEFSPGLWSHLPRFEHLEQLSVCASHVENADPANLALRLDSFIDPLTACAQLNALQLSKMNVSTAQLERITGALTQLTRLTFVDLRVESVEPLRAATSLFLLRLLLCLDAKGEFVQWRSALPPMPNITELYLQDNPTLCSLTREEAEPLNEALRAKMPNLTMDKLFQTPNPK